MKDKDRPSSIIRITGPLMFTLMGLIALLWFSFSLYEIKDELLSSSSIVLFDKGSFYMLGVGLGLSTLAFVTGFEFWLDKPLTERLTRLCTKMALLSVAIAILLPHASHFFFHNYLTNSSYKVCREASSQWLTDRRIVFVKSTENCHEIAEKRRQE